MSGIFSYSVKSTYDQQATPTNPNVGDIWYEKNSSRSIWYWNGTYWFSIQTYIASANNADPYNLNLGYGIPIKIDSNIFIEKFVIAYQIGGSLNDSNNYWLARLGYFSSNVPNGTLLSGVDSSAIIGTPFMHINLITTPNLYVNLSGSSDIHFTTDFYKSGNPDPISRFNIYLQYRLAK